jgi:hypothetical protein
MKLYGFLIDQLTKYNTIIWQVPTALFAANILVFDKMIDKPYFPYLLLSIVIFNSSLIFAFHKMIVQQRAIIDAVRKAEKSIVVEYADFIPNFKISKIRAPWLFVWTLCSLNLFLFLYSLYRIRNC